MASVTYMYASSWDKVFQEIKAALKEAGYPNPGWLTKMAGGNGNICCITGYYNEDKVENTTSSDALTYKVGSDGSFSLVTRNEGSGGKHSEPAGLIKIQHRSLKAKTPVLLFTERAPCVHCQQGLAQRANTFERDIYVQYITPYTDTNENTLDVIDRSATAVDAATAKEAVNAMRQTFKC
jgi:hypothetical protein